MNGDLASTRWLFTGFYGDPGTSRRMKTWNLLRNIDPHPFPWLVMGDFNEILYHSEKAGDRQRNENLMNNFRQTLNVCTLKDLGQVGELFIWSNKHESPSFTKEILDQAVANQA